MTHRVAGGSLHVSGSATPPRYVLEFVYPGHDGPLLRKTLSPASLHELNPMHAAVCTAFFSEIALTTPEAVLIGPRLTAAAEPNQAEFLRVTWTYAVNLIPTPFVACLTKPYVEAKENAPARAAPAQEGAAPAQEGAERVAELERDLGAVWRRALEFDVGGLGRYEFAALLFGGRPMSRPVQALFRETALTLIRDNAEGCEPLHLKTLEYFVAQGFAPDATCLYEATVRYKANTMRWALRAGVDPYELVDGASADVASPHAWLVHTAPPPAPTGLKGGGWALHAARSREAHARAWEALHTERAEYLKRLAEKGGHP